MKKNYLFALLFLFFAASTSFAQKSSPVGIWTNEDKESHFEIFKCGDKLCGKIVWLKFPDRDGKPKTDIENPDKNLRSRPIMGLVFMKDFEFDEDNKWDDGKIYDPKSGKTYSCYMKMIDKNKMEVKGYIGISLIGRTQTWTRVQ